MAVAMRPECDALAEVVAGRDTPRVPESNAPAGGRSPAGASGDGGMVAVEFALLAPLFLIVSLGVIVYGLYFGAWLAINQAAAEAARASIAGMSFTERSTLARTTAQTIIDGYATLLDISKVTITPAQGPAANLFQVSVTYDLSSHDFSVIGGLIPVPTQTPTVTAIVSNGGY